MRAKWISHAVTAAVAAGATVLVTQLVAPSLAQTSAPTGTLALLTQPLADMPGREMRMTLLDRVPGNQSPMHRHPGQHTFGYVIQGTYELGIDGGAPKTLHAGDTFYEPPGVLHSVSRNASATEQLKILVCQVADARNPSTVNE